MSLLLTYDELKTESIKDSIVKDLISGKNGIVFCENPLIIELDNGQHKPRELTDLLFYCYSKEDIAEIKKKSEKLHNFFKGLEDGNIKKN